MATPTHPRERTVTMPSKEERARDAATAAKEYQAERLAVIARTARLRAQRLAQEASNAPVKKEPAKISSVRNRSNKTTKVAGRSR